MLRKHVYFVVAIAAILTLLPFVQPSSITQAQESTITIGTLDLPVTLDPAVADNFMSWEILRHLYTGLTRQIPGTTTYELAAATDHQISEDGLTHTFTLRDDLVFTDGTSISAETFANSTNRILQLDRGGAAIIKTMIDSVTAIDSNVLEYQLFAPIPYFEALVALPPLFAYHPDDFPANDIDRATPTLIGNGSYLLDSWQQATVIHLRANPDYQFGDPAKTDEIVLQSYPETYELLLALQNHEIDVAWRDLLLPDAMRAVATNPELQQDIHPSLRMWYLLINADPQYDGSRVTQVRQAILTLIDRRRITSSYFGGLLAPAFSLVPEMLGEGYTPLWDTAIDPDASVALLTNQGYRRNGNNAPPFSINSTQNGYGDYYADAVRTFGAGFGALRPYITLVSNALVDAPVFYRSLREGDQNSRVALFAWTPLVAHPDAYLRPLLHSEGPIARENYYASDELDAVLDQARQTDDGALYQQAQEIVRDTYTIVPVWQDVVSIVYWNDIAGVTTEANYFLHYDLLERQ